MSLNFILYSATGVPPLNERGDLSLDSELNFWKSFRLPNVNTDERNVNRLNLTLPDRG